jgi:signal transduction histidine kinase
MLASRHEPPARLPPGHRHVLPDARRCSAEELARQIRLVGGSPIVRALLDSVNATLLVLNRERQVVASSAPGDGLVRLSGLRPGEVLSCVNERSAGGCGTTRACETCGALGAILGCGEERRPFDAECVISTHSGASIELDVRASPIELGGERFTVVSLRDISTAKRREALEQVFFHDVMNTVAGIRGWAGRLARPGADVGRAAGRLDLLSRHLEREIRDHRALVLAEEGVLVPERSLVSASELVEDVAAMLAEHAVARDRTLVTSVEPASTALETDRALLARVLVNMGRNALEASSPGETIRVAATGEIASASPGVRFSVANAAVMPAGVQARVFQRSFSTKGRGRGLGTYGMKLIGERYLGGRVSFVSAQGQGTTFTIALPARR